MNNKTKKDLKNPDVVSAQDPIVNQEELREVNGGFFGYGWVKSLSAECGTLGEGVSCNPFYW